MSQKSPASALRAVLQFPIAIAAVPLAFGQVAPDPAHLASPGAASEGDVKTYGPSALTPALQAEIALRDAADRAQAVTTVTPRTAAVEQRDEATPVAGLTSRIDRVLVDADAVPGAVWALGRGWKAEFAADGMTYHPRLGRTHASATTSFELARVSRGGEPISFRGATVRSEGERVVLERGSLREIYNLSLESLEQTFVFDTLAGQGDLVLDVAVASDWQVVPGEEHIRFVEPGVGEVRYGRAYAFDAAGSRIELARTWTGDGIALTVPASFLAGAVLPLTVDPVIGSTTSLVLDDDESNPDVCFDSASNRYWLAYQDFFTATDSDVFVVTMTTGGTLGTPFSIDFTGDYWAQPAVASSPASNNLLVVASTTPDGPGSANADIEGRLVDTAALTTGGAQFLIDTQTQSCTKPDVGGSWWTGASFADYCVVWEREFSTTDSDILARVVNQDGTFLTTVIFLANSGLESDFAPAVSKSRGDESFFGDFWNVAWIRDTDQNGQGTPYSHRIYFDGTLNGATEQVVFNTALASNVDVTSSFDTTVPGVGERPFIVAYERDVNAGDIYATVCTQLGPETTSNVSAMEDFDVALITRNPSIATDGTSFFLAFDELWWGASAGSTDYDTYALSGNIAYANNDAFVALSERHQRLQYTGSLQRRCEIASQSDGGGSADDAVVAWEDYSAGGANGSTIALAIFDSATLDTSAFQAIGEQYCDANAHGDSGNGGRSASFISCLGDASVGSQQRLACDEMKLNAFAYFIVSASTGNVNMPGASLGRLCLGGTIGRVVGGSILNTGSSGSISTLFNPLSLPTPTGSFSANPGQTLYFQCWHRDTAPGGAAASNFSNACAVTFRP